eukprot:g2589.t1
MRTTFGRTTIPVSHPCTPFHKTLNAVFRIPRHSPLVSRSQNFDLPDLEGDVEYYQRELNGRFNSTGILLDFNDNTRVPNTAPLLYDRSHFGRLKIEGKGVFEFLNNRTTNEFRNLHKGSGLDTLFLQSKGKIIDLATAYVLGNGVLLILSPTIQDALMEELDKFIFPGDEVEIRDVRTETRIFSLIGQGSQELLSLLNVQDSVLDGSYGTNEISGFQNGPVIVAKGNELNRSEGYTLIVDDSVAGDLYKNLIDAGGVPIGLLDWERLRVSNGRPGLETELRHASNPFEVGLFHAVSLSKGCFLGQESISRIYTKNTIRRKLWGIQFHSKEAVVSPEAMIRSEGKDVGRVTSIPVDDVEKDSTQKICLGFLRCKINKTAVDWNGTEVEIEGFKGTVRHLDYTNNDFETGIGSPIPSTPEGKTNVESVDKEKKLKEMQERLDAFMKQQKQQG